MPFRYSSNTWGHKNKRADHFIILSAFRYNMQVFDRLAKKKCSMANPLFVLFPPYTCSVVAHPFRTIYQHAFKKDFRQTGAGIT